MIRTVRRAFLLLDPLSRLRWGGVVVLSVLAASLETLGAGAIFALVASVADPGKLANVPVLGGLLVEMLERDHATGVMVMSGAIAAFFTLKNTVLFAHAYFQEKLTAESTTVMATRLMECYLHAPYTFHLNHNSSELIRNIRECIEDICRQLLFGIATTITECLLMAGVVVALLSIDPMLTLAGGVVLGGAALTTLRILQHRFNTVGLRLVSLNAKLLGAVSQTLESVKEIKVLGREDHFVDHFRALRAERSDLMMEHSLLNTAPRLVNEFILILGVVLVLVGVVLRGGDLDAVAPMLGVFGYASFRLLPSFNRIVQQLNSVRVGMPAVEVVSADFDRLLPIEHAVVGAALPFHQQIELRDVRFTYPGAQRPVLDGISLTIPHGATIGVTGATGAGKSTLVDIIIGLHQPQGGAVLVDGTDISCSLRSWRTRIGYVPQVIALSDDTLRRNVAMGLPDALIDDEQVWRALGLAQLADFVRTLPEGLDTVVGERGVRLSGGQRQRIGVARALLGEPEVLVFDEATSSLDVSTEAQISREIESLAGKMTIILIAHRFATLRSCERLIFLENGGLAGYASMQELMDISDSFRRMATTA